jgi:hypothetical protein
MLGCEHSFSCKYLLIRFHDGIILVYSVIMEGLEENYGCADWRFWFAIPLELLVAGVCLAVKI